jgi:hypothetical protein
MSCSAAYSLAGGSREVFVNAHKATLPIAQKVP